MITARVHGSRLRPARLEVLGPKRYELVEDYVYHDAARDCTLIIPAGFECDLASVPQLLWWLIAPLQLSIIAPLLHDWLYRRGGRPPAFLMQAPRAYTRKEADDLFRAAMKQERVSWWRRKAAYRAVRLFGGSSWRGQ